MNSKIPKCKECEYHKYKSQKGWDKERHYCHEPSKLSIGSFIKSSEYKTSPQWCPKRNIDIAENVQKEQYVLKAEETTSNPFSDGYYIGKSFIFQGNRYAIVDADIKKAKVYSSQSKAFKASEMEFNNYKFRAVKLQA